ncbi:hypothetical protein [Azospirillum soli]|uniref:hypothetical protein n=1 Tax=Azospirillum soli TaxID=1304799 RepID=UPI001AE99715|nr:hypothetical protein [Azospirillum soli]MBP2315523.1 hypothetical protein [Azospirillum soli]
MMIAAAQTTTADALVKDLAAGMAAAAAVEKAEPTPLSVAVAQARATLVYGLQRDAHSQGPAVSGAARALLLRGR